MWIEALGADSELVASVDVGALLRWAPIKGDRERLIGPDASRWLDAAGQCNIDLEHGRITLGVSPDIVTLAVQARGVGAKSAWSCMAPLAPGHDGAPDDASPRAQLASGGRWWNVEARGDHRLLLSAARDAGDAARPGDREALSSDSPIASAMARMDAPLWIVGSPPASVSPATASVAFGTDELTIVARGTGNDEIGSATVRATLRTLSQSIYLPGSVADAAALTWDDQQWEAALDVDARALYAIDLRWLTPQVQAVGPAAPGVLALLDDEPAVAVVEPADETASTVAAGVVAAAEPNPIAAIGVAECDAYLAAYVTCIADKFPEASRESALAAMVTAADAWRKVAEVPEARASLAETCKTVHAAVASTCT